MNNFAAAAAGFNGKKLSILGDSISTYEGISNSTSYNTTIGSNAVYYNQNGTNYKFLSSEADTWWMQAMSTLGMKLCVNNSWSGSCATDVGSGNSVAYKYGKRCVQLHNDTGSSAVNPDIIAIYLGTNDIKNITSAAQLKTSGGDSYPMGATMNADGTAKVSFNYSTVTGKVNTSSYVPGSILEAYALMVYRTLSKYTSAEVYCFTLLPNESQNQYNRDMYDLYNAGIRAIVKHFKDSGKKVYLVDLYEGSGFNQELALFDLFLANTLHPNEKGMDVITNCFLSSLVANSQYRNKTQHSVTYELDDVYVKTGKVTTATAGEKFSVNLLPTHSEFDLDVTVTMNGVDVTDTACSKGATVGTILIDNVTGPIQIKAEAVYETRNYRWELRNGNLEPCVPDGNDYHVPGEIDVKELIHRKGTYSDGSFSDTQYQLPEPVVLLNDEPWVVEWKANGAWGSTMLFTTKGADAERNNSYLFFSGANMLGFGFCKKYSNGQTGTDSSGNKTYEYPTGFANFGVSTTGLTLNSATTHTYRMVNQVSDDSNMVHLYVDGVELGTMNNYYAATVDRQIQDDWFSGKDFVFNFLGSNERTIRQCSIEYLQIWEGGNFDTGRLLQLQKEFENLSDTVSGYNGYAAYQTAVNASANFTGNQEQCDAHVDAIINARNAMTAPCDSYTNSGEIISVELLTGEYARIGKQVGLRITTAPDVERITVGLEELIGVSALVQTMERKIEGAKHDTLVKVWLVTFDTEISDQQTVTYTVNTYLSGQSSAAEALDKIISFL